MLNNNGNHTVGKPLLAVRKVNYFKDKKALTDPETLVPLKVQIILNNRVFVPGNIPEYIQKSPINLTEGNSKWSQGTMS